MEDDSANKSITRSQSEDAHKRRPLLRELVLKHVMSDAGSLVADTIPLEELALCLTSRTTTRDRHAMADGEQQTPLVSSALLDAAAPQHEECFVILTSGLARSNRVSPPLAQPPDDANLETNVLCTLVNSATIWLRIQFVADNPLPLNKHTALRPARSTQIDTLHSTLSTILWRIADKGKAWVCLPQDTAYVQQSQEYFQDGVTEKFQEDPGPGTLLFLYSAVITRGIAKTQSDLSSERASLAVSSDEGQQCIVTLILTGRATPYLHNGVVYAGDENSYSRPQFGVLTRSDVGLLVYDENSEGQIPGSRLKTPSVPVWVTSATGHYGVLFNTNKDLLRDYHAERRFDLLYYNCSPTTPASQAVLSVDTRFGEAGRDDMGSPQLERLIHTKWQDARVNWNGIVPFV